MYNIYFKLNEENPQKKDLVYMRSMNMMTANNNGKEVFAFYDPKNFIQADEYFEKAELISQFVRCPNLRLSQNKEDKALAHFVLIYATDQLGIGYNLESESYEIISSKYMKNYKKGTWEFVGPCETVFKDKYIIIKTLLQQKNKPEVVEVKVKQKLK